MGPGARAVAKLAEFDASALVKLVVEEGGSELVAELWDRCDTATSSRLAYAEVCAALAASFRNREIDAAGYQQAKADWDEFWRAVRPVEATVSVELVAGAVAERRLLRGADAVRLASVLALDHDDLVFAVWDERLHRGAIAEAICVVPDQIAAPG